MNREFVVNVLVSSSIIEAGSKLRIFSHKKIICEFAVKSFEVVLCEFVLDRKFAN